MISSYWSEFYSCRPNRILSTYTLSRWQIRLSLLHLPMREAASFAARARAFRMMYFADGDDAGARFLDRNDDIGCRYKRVQPRFHFFGYNSGPLPATATSPINGIAIIPSERTWTRDR